MEIITHNVLNNMISVTPAPFSLSLHMYKYIAKVSFSII